MGSTFSIIFIGLSVGIVLGTVFGGIISDSIGISATFYFAALAGLIGLFFFAYFSAQKTR